jgi:hypothetical protein
MFGKLTPHSLRVIYARKRTETKYSKVDLIRRKYRVQKVLVLRKKFEKSRNEIERFKTTGNNSLTTRSVRLDANMMFRFLTRLKADKGTPFVACVTIFVAIKFDDATLSQIGRQLT